MDPRIGTLVRDGKTVHYAFVNGLHKPAVEGSLADVERALGLSPGFDGRTSPDQKKGVGGSFWDVRLYFQHPAWDEVDGILYPGIFAKSKSEANRIAAKQAHIDGHTGANRGRYWFIAVKSD